MSDDIEWIDEPLFTEDGFVNPLCMAQLEAAMNNMQPTYERLSDDPEWNTPKWTFLREITGHLAHWAVRQIADPDPTPFAPGLENVIGFLDACIRPRFDEREMAELSLCDINRMLHEILMPEEFFRRWNDAEVLQGWLDLDALLHNVCISIRDERRAFEAFNEEFDADAATKYCNGEGI